MQRLPSPAEPAADDAGRGPALAALERAEESLAEAETLLTRLAAEARGRPAPAGTGRGAPVRPARAARKHEVAVADLPALLDSLAARLAALETGAAEVAALERAAAVARARAYEAAAASLSAARTPRGARLERAVARELPPLRLDNARFRAEVAAAGRGRLGPGRHR